MSLDPPAVSSAEAEAFGAWFYTGRSDEADVSSGRAGLPTNSNSYGGGWNGWGAEHNTHRTHHRHPHMFHDSHHLLQSRDPYHSFSFLPPPGRATDSSRAHPNYLHQQYPVVELHSGRPPFAMHPRPAEHLRDSPPPLSPLTSPANSSLPQRACISPHLAAVPERSHIPPHPQGYASSTAAPSNIVPCPLPFAGPSQHHTGLQRSADPGSEASGSEESIESPQRRHSSNGGKANNGGETRQDLSDDEALGSGRKPRGKRDSRSPSPLPSDKEGKKMKKMKKMKKPDLQDPSPTRARDMRVHRSAVEKCDEGFGKSMREVTMKLMAHYGFHAKHSRTSFAFMEVLTTHFFLQTNTGKCDCHANGWQQCHLGHFSGASCEACPVCRIGQFVEREGLNSLPYGELCPCKECVMAGVTLGLDLKGNSDGLAAKFRKRRFHKDGVCNCKKLDLDDLCILDRARMTLATIFPSLLSAIKN